MADNLDPEDIRRLNEQLRDLTDAITSQSASLKQSAQAAGVFNTSLKSSSKTVTTGSEVLKKAGEDFNSQMKQYGQTYDRTTKEWVSAKDKEMRMLTASQKAVYDELQAKRANILKEVQRNKLFSDELRNLGYSQDANGKLVKVSVELTSAQKRQIRELDNQQSKMQELQKRYDEFGQTMKNSLGGLVKGFGNFAAGLAKGESSFSTLNPIIDLVADALGSVAKLIPVFGDGIASGIKVGAEAAKLTLELLDKNLKMFQDISNMGGLVSNGMEGLQKQVVDSGMSMEGFTKIVKENGTELSAFGGTVGLGADKFMGAIGQMTKKGGAFDKAGMDLRKLGLTADQIGEQAAAFLQQEIRLGRGREMTQDQLAKGTIAYVKELDLLQKVTGLSREEVQKQRDVLMSDSRYRAARDKMMASGQEQGAKALDAFVMNIKDPELKRGVMDLASGVANTDAAGKALVTFGNTIPDVINNLSKATSPEEAAKRYDEAQNTLQKAAQEASAKWRDVMAYGSDAMINYATQSDIASGKFKGSMEDALKIQQKQLEGQNGLTDKTVAAQAEMDKMKNSMFAFSNTLMDKAAPAVQKFTEALNAGVDFINKTFKTKTQGSASTTPAPMAETGGGAATGNPNLARQGAKARARALQRQEAAPPAAAPALPAAPGAQAPAQQVSAADVERLLKFTGNTGSKEHFEKLDPAVKSNFLSMIADYGKPVQINSAFRSMEEQASVDSGTNPKAQPGKSKHNIGRALDLNSSQVAELKTLGLLDKYGFNTINGDPPHIEMARTGGIFSGPESGYPVMLHGREAVLPQQQLDSIKSILEQVTKESLPTVTPGVSAPNAHDESINILKDLYNVMAEKLDTIADKLSSGNDTREELLQYSRA